MLFIYPSYPHSLKIDEEFETEYLSSVENGINVVKVDFEQRKIIGKYDNTELAIYRGWMLSEDDYLWLQSKFNLDTKFQDYNLFQNIQNWYPKLESLTFETEIFKDREDFEKNFVQKHDKYVVKNYTKSLGIAHSKEEVLKLLDTQKQNLFDGIVLRKFEDFLRNEQRYFVYKKKPVLLYKYFPLIAMRAIQALDSDKLYTIDVARGTNGKEIIVEIGDGQVCSLKSNDKYTKEFSHILQICSEHRTEDTNSTYNLLLKLLEVNIDEE